MIVDVVAITNVVIGKISNLHRLVDLYKFIVWLIKVVLSLYNRKCSYVGYEKYCFWFDSFLHGPDQSTCDRFYPYVYFSSRSFHQKKKKRRRRRKNTIMRKSPPLPPPPAAADHYCLLDYYFCYSYNWLF